MRENYEAGFVPYQSCLRVDSGRVLILAPHPDDEAIGCGGAIIQHVDNNDYVQVIIVTNGMLGNPELADKIRCGTASEVEIENYIETRREESRKAGKILGYGEPLFWDIPDRYLIYNEQMVIKIFDAVNQVKPSIIYCPSIYEMHPDHRDLSIAVLEAINRLKFKPDLFMYEIGRPIPSPDILLDITSQWDKKIAAIRCFGSQLEVCSLDKYISALNCFRTYTLTNDIKKAEAYLLIRGEGFNERFKNVLKDELWDRGKKLRVRKSRHSRIRSILKLGFLK